MEHPLPCKAAFTPTSHSPNSTTPRDMSGPLHGIRIAEYPSAACPLSLRLAMSFAGRIAAGLGASVVKLGSREDDPVQAAGPRIGSSSALSIFLDQGKTYQAVGSDRNAVSALMALGAAPDIVLCDAQAHIQLESLAQTSIRTVLSMFPVTSEANACAATEFTVMALSGLLDLVGDPDREPLRMGGHQLAYACGLAAYSGSVAALCARQPGSAAEVIRVTLADVAVWLNWKVVAMASWSAAGRARLGRDAEWQVVRCADGWIALVFLEADWPVLRDFVNDPRLAEVRFNDRAERRRDARTVASIVEGVFLRYTRQELKALALAKRLPLGPVWNPIELEDDPQNRARSFFSRQPNAPQAPLLMPRLPVLWNGQTFPAARASAAASSPETEPRA